MDAQDVEENPRIADGFSRGDDCSRLPAHERIRVVRFASGDVRMSVLPDDDKKPFLPYFTTVGWLAIVTLFAIGFAAGVALAQWAWSAL